MRNIKCLPENGLFVWSSEYGLKKEPQHCNSFPVSPCLKADWTEMKTDQKKKKKVKPEILGANWTWIFSLNMVCYQ